MSSRVAGILIVAVAGIEYSMSTEYFDLDPRQLLTAIHNQLGQCFFAASRDHAKQLYLAIENDQKVPFMIFSGPEKEDVNCHLTLDHSRFVGKLNFSTFRKALASHLQRIAGKLNTNQDLNIFTAANSNEIIFHIPGMVESDDGINVLVTGLKQQTVGDVTIGLMFLDPDYFARNDT